MSASQGPSQVEAGSSEAPAPIPSANQPTTAAAAAVEAGPSSAATGAAAPGDGKAQEKTISCVSCRRRKLKCDRVKPKCSTCTRLRHDCEYPERRRNLGSKRRNMKELEARLAQVETKLVSESKTSPLQQPSAGPHMDMNWNNLGMDMDVNLDLGEAGRPPNTSFDIPATAYSFAPHSSIPMQPGDLTSELIALGLQEPLPPQDMIDELHEIFFDTFHHTMPMIHKLRYYASLSRAPHMRPPICLRYALWTIAASISDKYMCIEDIMYERARRYVEAAEMKGHGEAFVSIYHTQTWGLIGTYEAKKTYFSRAWVSVGRMVRLSQMLGLHRVDSDTMSAKEILPPARDFIEQEERRRTFWAGFYGDRWASSGTGWPMIIDEKDIETNLPSTEEAYESGRPETTVSLQEALTPEGASKISPLAGVIVSATLFGHNFEHLHRKGPNENPDDLANGEFWKRHRRMDNVLSNTFMFLPEQLRLPANIRNMNVVFLHMNIHASSICLHQAAVMTATKFNLDANFIRQSRNRCLMAAEEISNIMRLVSHMDCSRMNSWMGFCLYVAGGVFVGDQKSENPQPQSLSHLEFLFAAMQALGRQHSVTKHFTVQLELDMEAAGIGGAVSQKGETNTQNAPMMGILADRHGKPMTAAEATSFIAPVQLNGCQSTAGAQQSGRIPSDPISATPLSGIMPSSGSTSARESPAAAPPAFPPGWEFSQRPSENKQEWSPNQGNHLGVGRNDSVDTQNGVNMDHFPGPYSTFDQSLTSGTTPSSTSTTSNTMQYPYRGAESGSQNKNPNYEQHYRSEQEQYPSQTDWNIPDSFVGYDSGTQAADSYDRYIVGSDWVQNQPQG